VIRRRTTVRAVLATLLALSGLAVTSPASHAKSKPAVSVVITGLTPSSLGDRGTLRMTGVVTNSGTTRWTDLQAYLVIRPNPLTTRATLLDAAEADQGFAGTRIVDVGRFDEIGDLEPQQSTAFELKIPVRDLPIDHTDGVYPVGVQILGTDSKGHRDTTSIARATTLLPHMTGRHVPADTTVVWPFLMPNRRTSTDRIVDAESLLTAMGEGGQLRSLLDLAKSAPPSGRGFLVDPALVKAADDLASGDDAARKLTPEEIAVATTFRDDLVALAQSPSAWILDYDRTDVLALAQDDTSQRRLFGAVERATDSVVDDFDLSRHRASWPTRTGVDTTLLRALRERGDYPVVVSSSALPRWNTSDGVLVPRSTSSGDVPLLVDDELTRDVPGDHTLATLRQRVLASAALASLEGGDALVVMDPSIDLAPGATWSASASYLAPRALDQVRRGDRYRDALPSSASARPISHDQVSAANRATEAADLLSAAAVDSKDLDDAQARAVAGVLGVRWRSDRSAGLTAADELGRRFDSALEAITVMAPPAVTLSSSAGGFPLTISNGSPTPVRVGIRLDSSNPALTIPDQKPIEIAAGERRTITVDVDLAKQNTTTLTAHLTTPDGRPFGSSKEFIVRSSRVGIVLWATMGAAGLFVLFALVRRFRKRRSDRISSPAGEPDD